MKNYGLITSIEQLEKFVDKLISDGSVVAVDVETGYRGPAKVSTSVRPDDPDSMIVGISFTNSTNWARYVPLTHDLGNNLSDIECAQLFWKLFHKVPIIAHNGAFELRFFRKWFLRYLSYDESVVAANGYFPLFSDTLAESYIVQQTTKHNLKFLTKQLFDHDQTDLLSLFPGLALNKANTLRFNSLTLDPHVISYACEDAVWCLALHEHFYAEVKESFMFRTEMQLIPIVCRMEDYGVRLDWQGLAAEALKAQHFLDQYDVEIQRELSEMCGEPILINLNSPKQLGEVLFDKLGMKSAKQTPTGAESVGAIALEALSKRHPVVRKVLDYKEIKTLITKFLDRYPKEYTYATDGRAHPSHNQLFVITGRFSVSSPNYQQQSKGFVAEVPGLGEQKVSHFYQLNSGEYFTTHLRRFIIAPDEHYILGFDFSQIELRVLAGMAGEPYLVQAFNDDVDVHKVAASLIFGIPVEEVTKQQRDKAKTLQFALLYGMGIKSLADRLALPKDEAQALHNQYFSSFSSVAAFVDKSEALGRNNHFSESLFGRKHAIWNYQSSEDWKKAEGDRQATNYRVQGTAADILKVVMVRVDKALAQAGLLDRVHMVMTIHDALEFYVHESVDPEDLISVLYPAVVIDLPGFPRLKADWHWGYNWADVEELNVDLNGVLEPEYDDIRKREREVIPIYAPYEVKSLHIILQGMPDKISWVQFLELVKAKLGSNKIVVSTPQGEITLKSKTSLTPDDYDKIIGLLPGAEVGWGD